MAGFGHFPFGKGPFGKSNLGEDLIVQSFPVEYLEDGTPTGLDPQDNDQNPLLMVLKTYANSVNNRREDVDSMDNLTNYEKAPDDILILIGDLLGLGIDKNDPDFLKRSFVGNASQWLQIKSSVKGYSVRGLASGFLVFVDNYWRIDPSYWPLIPLRNRFRLKPIYSDPWVDKLYYTNMPPGTFAGTPTEEDETYAKSSFLKVIFEVKEPRKVGVDYNALLDLVIDKITDVVGIHHELTSPEFRIRLFASLNISADMRIDESIVEYNFNEFDHFDIIPGDEIGCDRLSVDLTAS